jgi:hypothetical protein
MIAKIINVIRRLLGRPARKRKRTIVLLSALVLVALVASPILAQTNDAPIQDNSFLIEEAYNQEAGVVQHIQTFSRATRGGDWAYTFTEEWPATGLRNQLSYTLPITQLDGARGSGDVALNYRYQWIGDGEARLAVAPRLTLLLPTGNHRRGLGGGGTGFQVMLPASTVLTPSLVAHWNLGATITPSTDTNVITAGQSFVWLANHRFNVLVETLWTRTSDHAGHVSQTTVSPGVRWSYDLPHHLQIVPGIAFPISNPGTAKSVFLYLSFEHPFTKQLSGDIHVQ